MEVKINKKKKKRREMKVRLGQCGSGRWDSYEGTLTRLHVIDKVEGGYLFIR